MEARKSRWGTADGSAVCADGPNRSPPSAHGGRDLIIDSVPILAWRRADPDAAFGHAPTQHPRPLLRGYRVHTLICRGSGLPLFFLLSPANYHNAPFAQPLLAWAIQL